MTLTRSRAGGLSRGSGVEFEDHAGARTHQFAAASASVAEALKLIETSAEGPAQSEGGSATHAVIGDSSAQACRRRGGELVQFGSSSSMSVTR